MKIGKSFICHRDVIGPENDPYMVRLKLIDTPWFAIRIHRIMRSDADRDLHDHPWSFVSFILWGGYRECVPYSRDGRAIDHIDTLYRHAPAIVFHPATDLHRIVIKRPATTLVFCGPRYREWGFHTSDGWVPWRIYLGESNGSVRVPTDINLVEQLRCQFERCPRHPGWPRTVHPDGRRECRWCRAEDSHPSQVIPRLVARLARWLMGGR